MAVVLFVLIALACLPAAVSAGNRIWVPVRWCGVEGAPSMDNPGTVNEATSDDVLWRRHERPTDAIYIPFSDMSFRAGATAAIKEGPQSFPIIRDPSGSGGNLEGDTRTRTTSWTPETHCWSRPRERWSAASTPPTSARACCRSRARSSTST